MGMDIEALSRVEPLKCYSTFLRPTYSALQQPAMVMGYCTETVAADCSSVRWHSIVELPD